VYKQTECDFEHHVSLQKEKDITDLILSVGRKENYIPLTKNKVCFCSRSRHGKEEE